MIPNRAQAWFWFSRLALTVLAGFFLAVGVGVLRQAYALTNPFEFILTFFASNLIILISGTLGLGFVLAMIRRLRPPAEASPSDEDKK